MRGHRVWFWRTRVWVAKSEGFETLCDIADYGVTFAYSAPGLITIIALVLVALFVWWVPIAVYLGGIMLLIAAAYIMNGLQHVCDSSVNSHSQEIKGALYDVRHASQSSQSSRSVQYEQWMASKLPLERKVLLIRAGIPLERAKDDDIMLLSVDDLMIMAALNSATA